VLVLNVVAQVVVAAAAAANGSYFLHSSQLSRFSRVLSYIIHNAVKIASGDMTHLISIMRFGSGI
jgi:hypothetical protein